MSSPQLTQFLSTRNSKIVTSVEAQVSSPWQGDWEPTRDYGYDRVLITLFSSAGTALGGTFIFEFSEDALTATVSETRTITDFAELRDFDLMNVGAFFRVSFEPSVALGANSVIITTQFMSGYQGPFVRLGNQEIEEQNSAFGSTFAYLKAFRSSGKSIGITATRGGSLQVANEDFEIARGNVVGRSEVHVDGRNGDIDTTSTPEDIFLGSGAYTGLPTGSPETVQVFSSSTSDTSAGTGARTVRITGLATSASTEYTTEDITMNGTTAVVSVGSWYRVNSVRVLTAGSAGANVGTLTVRHSTTTTNVFAQVAAGVGQSAIGAWTVPAGQTLFLTRIRVAISRASGAAGSAQVLLLVREFGTGSWTALRNFEVTTGGGIGFSLTVPIEVPAQADIKFRVQSVSDNNTIASGFFDGILVDD